MASNEAFAAIKGVFDASWVATPIYFENESWQLEAESSHFLFVEVFGELFQQASIGAGAPADNLWRESGELWIHVLTQEGIGSATARTLARSALDLFLGQDVGTLTFGDATMGAGEAGTLDGNYWRMTARIEWERDET